MKCEHCDTECSDARGARWEAEFLAVEHTDDCCRAALRVKYDAVLSILVPSARIVWENGGWSGASGNWPLVEAYGLLEKLKAAAPDVYARVVERVPAREYQDGPCELCQGTGKGIGKSLAEQLGEAFESGKDTQRLIDRGGSGGSKRKRT